MKVTINSPVVIELTQEEAQEVLDKLTKLESANDCPHVFHHALREALDAIHKKR